MDRDFSRFLTTVPVYYGTTFFQQVGLSNAFLITTIMNIVNVATTPASFYMIEHFGRRTLLLYGAAIMCLCEFIVAIVGVASSSSHAAYILALVFFFFVGTG